MMKKMMKDDERWHNVIILQTSTIEKSFYLDSVMSGIEFISILVIFLVLVPQTTSFRGRPPVFFGLTNNFASNRVSYDAQTTVLKNSRLQGVVSGLFFEQVALTGLISKRDQFSNHFVFKTVFEKVLLCSLTLRFCYNSI